MDSFLQGIALIMFFLVLSYVLRNLVKSVDDKFDNFQERLSAELEESRRQMRIEIRDSTNRLEHELKKLNDKD